MTSIEFSDECTPVSTRTTTRASIAISHVTGELSSAYLTSPLSLRARSKNDLAHFTIDKLKYASLGLYGRDVEVKLLKDALINMVMSGASKEQERQLILISGYSGTGKTALANHALQKLTMQLGGLYARGKYDLNQRSQEPYSGISAACSEICGAIVELQNRNPSRAEELCRQITTD